MNRAEAIGVVVDLALLAYDDLDDNERTALGIVAKYIDNEINSQTGQNRLLGDRLLDDLVDCTHPGHNADRRCPACSDTGKAWEPRGGWSNRQGLMGLLGLLDEEPAPDNDDEPNPWTEPTLWDEVA